MRGKRTQALMLAAMLLVAGAVFAVDQKKPAAVTKSVPTKPAAPRTINTSPLTFEGVGTKTVTTSALTFEGVGTKTIATSALTFEGVGTTTVATSPLLFEGVGLVNVNSSPLSFEGTYTPPARMQSPAPKTNSCRSGGSSARA